MASVVSNGLSYFDRLDQAADYLVVMFKINAPKKTFNLAINGIRKAYADNTGFPIIVIGGEVAPYAIYTNEPWISDRWLNKQTGVMAINPNQGWIQQTIRECIPTLQAILSGSMTLEEYATLMNVRNDSLDSIFEKAAEQYATS